MQRTDYSRISNKQNKQAKMFNEAQEGLFRYNTSQGYWFSSPLIKTEVFTHSLWKYYQRDWMENVVLDLKLNTSCSSLHYIWLQFLSLNNYTITFSIRKKAIMHWHWVILSKITKTLTISFWIVEISVRKQKEKKKC